MNDIIQKATVNGLPEWRVYRHGQIIGRFETERNAKIFANAQDMLDVVDYIRVAYRNDLFYNAPGHIKLKIENITVQLQ